MNHRKRCLPIGLMLVLFLATTLSNAAETTPSKVRSNPAMPSGRIAAPPPVPGGQQMESVVQKPGRPVLKNLPGKIYFKTPKQGDHFTQGDKITLHWDRQGNVQANCFQLFLFKGLSQVGVITNQWGNPYFQWTVPANQSGSNFKIRLRTCDNQYHADSATFPIIQAKADLSIARHSVTPVKMVAGGDREIIFKARIDNIGSKPSVAAVARLGFTATVPAQGVSREIALPPMPFGGHHYINEPVSLYQHGLWNYRLELIVPEPGENDPNASNNHATGTYTVGSHPDVHMLSIHKSPTHAQTLNRTVQISGPVRNDGNVAAQDFKITVSCSKCNMGLASGSAHVSKSETIDYLPPGETHWFYIGFSWPCAGHMTCRARADSENVLHEFRENNNQQEIGVRIKVF